MSVSVEGTGFNGEEKGDDENSEFYQWMLSKDGGNAKRSLINKLIEAGFDSIEMLKSIENDLDDLAKELGLKTAEKIKLRAIIHQASNRHTVTDTEEREAVISMERKIVSIKNAINLVATTKHNIEEEVVNHTKTIKTTFKQFHEVLNKRELELITKLNQIANEKKNKLQDVSNTLEQQSTQSQQQLNQCHKRLKKSIGLEGVDARKQDILKIAKDIDNIKIVTKGDPIISDNKINIAMNETVMIKSINSFGHIYGGVVPILLSLEDNKDCSVQIKWKLNSKQQNSNNHNNKLKIEWTETKSDDIDQFEAKWQYNKQFDLNDNNNETVGVTVDNKTANYLFRIQYFDGYKWSTNSNIKSLSVKEICDSWDPNCKHNELSIIGNSIVNTRGNQRSAYLTRVVNDGIHVWRFKIDQYTSSNQMIGVWKATFDAYTEAHLGCSNNGTNSLYCLILNNGYKYGGATGGQNYADKCQNGDTVEMTLDLVNLTLSYKINDKDHGKAFDVEKTSYKAAVTLRQKDTKYTLLSYQHLAQ